MYMVVYMDEMSKANEINMPLPPEDAPEEEKDRFANRYFEVVLPKFEVCAFSNLFPI